MSKPTVAGFNGLGGANELGFILEGFELVHRSGTLTLGANIIEANRHVMGWDWNSSFGEDERSWRVMPGTDVVTSNPPCS